MYRYIARNFYGDFPKHVTEVLLSKVRELLTDIFDKNEFFISLESWRNSGFNCALVFYYSNAKNEKTNWIKNHIREENVN